MVLTGVSLLMVCVNKMRDIKFRVWSTIRKSRMIFLDSKGERFSSKDLVNKTDWKVMQYTGLKDRNGKEIYEGDIVTKRSEIPIYENALDGGEREIVGHNGIVQTGEVRIRASKGVVILNPKTTINGKIPEVDMYEISGGALGKCEIKCQSTKLVAYRSKIIGNIYEGVLKGNNAKTNRKTS